MGTFATASYRQRDAVSGVVRQVLREHLATFRAWLDDASMSLPAYVDRELRKAFECGDPSLGFARVRCRTCAADIAVAFSC